MLSQISKSKIKSKLNNIYKFSYSKKDLNFYYEEIKNIIKIFNKENHKKKKIISEKTSIVICYGDNIFNNKKKLLFSL